MRTLILPLVLLAACKQVEAPPPPAPEPAEAAPSAALPVSAARTAESMDTTTAEERQAATASDAAGRSLGTTIASLGDPASPGFWLETPLVSAAGPGQVRLRSGGTAVQVELRPVGGEGGGSRISLAAIRLLGLTLTDLPELEVFAL